MAHDLLSRADPVTAGLWPRASALLGRQALEMALDDLWKHRAPGVERCSTHAQLLCLPSFLDENLAERASHAWRALSRGCHQHPYELAPAAEELAVWLDIAGEVVAVIGSGTQDQKI
jgi:hypothetical protein